MPCAVEHVSAWEAALVLGSGNVDSHVHLTRERLFPPAVPTCRGRVAVDTLRADVEGPTACAS
jgi:hypothetical protein